MKITDFTYFYPEKPVLISKTQRLFNRINEDIEWIAEKKYNGTRLQLHYFNGEFQFWNRHGNKIRFTPDAELQAEFDALKPKLFGYCLFDGELRDKKVKGIRNKIMIYDVFIFNNNLLIGMPFKERRIILSKLFFEAGDPLGLTEQFSGDFHKLFEAQANIEEIEGLVFKNKNGLLNLGRKNGLDSRWMYKVRKPTKNYKF